jgi:serine/threonine protein kinase/tetratricopeptide (TPR) repeat protein
MTTSRGDRQDDAVGAQPKDPATATSAPPTPPDTDATRYGESSPAAAGAAAARAPDEYTTCVRLTGDSDGPRAGRGSESRLRRVGDYVLLQELGRGGMGVVYKARDLKLNRLVALKMIRDARNATGQDFRRFLSEARAAARLDHPHIAPIYEIGEADGLPYFAMALVEGGSLKQRVAEGPLPPSVAAELLRQVAEAVQHAHDRGIVHRDIKPANVLLQRDEDGPPGAAAPDSASTARGSSDGAGGSAARLPVPKVVDFGLARVRGQEGLTATGEILGTPSYMPPEQASGRGDDIGPLADVYALGAVLYCLLTGRPPFQAATEAETLRQVLDQDPVPPRQLNAGVPRDLQTVCLKCLEKDPTKRYPSAQALADDLDRFLAGEPILARPVGRLGRGWRWCRRKPVVAGLLALLALVIAGSLGGLSALYALAVRERARAEEAAAQANASATEARQRQAEADAERTHAETEGAKARKVSEYLSGIFRGADPLRLHEFTFVPVGRPGEKLTAGDLLDQAAKKLGDDRELHDQPALRAAVMDAIGNAYRSLGLLEKAEPLLSGALELRRQTGAPAAEVAASEHNLGWLYHDLGRYGKAEALYRSALEARRNLPEPDPLLVAQTQFNLAWLLTEWGDYVAAEDLFRQVLEARTALLGPGHREVGLVKAGLAALYLDKGESGKALVPAMQAFEAMRSQEGLGLLAEGLNCFQTALINRYGPAFLRHYDEDERLLKRSLAIAVDQLGPKHAYVAAILYCLGDLADAQDKDAEATAYYEQCLAVARESVTLAHPKSVRVVAALARRRALKGDLAGSDALFDELLSKHVERFGKDSSLVADALVEYAEELWERGSAAAEKARATQGQALALYRKGDPPRGRLYARCLWYVAMDHVRREDHARGEELLGGALKAVRRQYGDDHADVGAVLGQLARARLKQGKTEGAEDMLNQALRTLRAAGGDHAGALADVYAGLWLLYRDAGRLAEAADAAKERYNLLRRAKDAAGVYDCACAYGRLVPLVGRGKPSLTPEDEVERGRYADLAMEALGEAVKLGFKDAGRMREDDGLRELRSREDFKKLLQELGAK